MKKKDVAPIVSAMGILTSIVTDLVKFVTKLGGTMEAIHRLATPEGAETLEAVAKVIVDGFKKVEQVKSAFLKLISNNETLTVEASDGQATIAAAKKTFKFYIDSDFRNWKLDNPGQATAEMSVNVYEMTADATFAQMFGSLADNLDSLVVPQAQIVRFCEKYPNWLRQDGYGTFFLIKEDGKYFVVNVYVDGDGLEVSCLSSRERQCLARCGSSPARCPATYGLNSWDLFASTTGGLSLSPLDSWNLVPKLSSRILGDFFV